MSILKLTMFDFDEKTQEPKAPLTVEMEYNSDMTLEEQGLKKVSIYMGDNVTGGSVMVPLEMLNAGMTALMQMTMKREAEEAPKIIMPDLPKIILPK